MLSPINKHPFFTSFLPRIMAFCTCSLAISASMTACTPALNWREVRFESADGTTLRANLPCKPDTATRQQQLGDQQIELSMMGCMVNDTTFTLSRIPVLDPLSAPKILAAWQASAVANVKADPVPKASVAIVKGAASWPPATRMVLSGANTQAQLLWFANQTATGLTLYQAALYGKQISNEATSTFLEGLKLQ